LTGTGRDLFLDRGARGQHVGTLLGTLVLRCFNELLECTIRQVYVFLVVGERVHHCDWAASIADALADKEHVVIHGLMHLLLAVCFVLPLSPVHRCDTFAVMGNKSSTASVGWGTIASSSGSNPISISVQTSPCHKHP
jgi:hypothetical protein